MLTSHRCTGRDIFSWLQVLHRNLMVLPRQVVVSVHIILHLMPRVLLLWLLRLIINKALVLETELRRGLQIWKHRWSGTLTSVSLMILCSFNTCFWSWADETLIKSVARAFAPRTTHSLHSLLPFVERAEVWKSSTSYLSLLRDGCFSLRLYWWA